MRLKLRYSIYLVLFTIIVLGSKGYAQKSVNATRTSEEIELDGYLNEDCWSTAETAGDFITNFPNYGDKSKFKTEVKTVFTHDAIYFGAELYDPEPDSVSYSLSQRDDTGNADWFGILLDTYGKKQNAFIFIITAAGVEVDGLMNDDDFDRSWNAVWKSNTVRRDFGWSVEVRIPYSAIRFPKDSVQDWKINFKRSIRRSRSESYWNPVNPLEYGEIQQSGNLTGIKNINPPLRLSFTPYLTSYVENSYDASVDRQTWKYRTNGGMDLKYGVSEAFTLDMTLIPDFGQTVSDNQVLNLGPFEVQFDENRAFFTEGVELFTIGNIFYSRRVGGNPFYLNSAFNQVEPNEVITESPSTAPLLNATKFSGRTKGGLGIGVFNAIEGEAFVLAEDETGNERAILANPHTNYNVLALSQNFKNNNTLSFINTNVMRDAAARDANVSGLTGALFTKNRNYKTTGFGKMSAIFDNDTTIYGHHIGANFEKVQGQYRFNVGFRQESDEYDPNDLGFLYNNNSREYYLGLFWNQYTPKGRFLRKWANVEQLLERLYAPDKYIAYGLSGSFNGTFKNFLTAGVNFNVTPFGRVDHFESRSFGVPVNVKQDVRIGGFYSSDYSKKYALDVRGGFNQYFGSARKNWDVTVSPRVRVSDQFFLVWRSQFSYLHQDFGYVNVTDADYSDDIILGTRNREVVTNTFTAEFLFTKRMGVDVRLRHYWQQVEYQYFSELHADGEKSYVNYSGRDANGNAIHDLNFNAFSVDLNYKWVFIPGSELRFVWKNNILASNDGVIDNYFVTFDNLFQERQVNSFSLKLLVFVDALYFKSKKSRK